MTEGIHWEWRGFGAVSSNFVDRFERLEPAFPEYDRPQELEDLYLWVPGLEVNIKVRPLLQTEPFKFKRIQQKDGDLEKWWEDPKDIFEFPLSKAAWATLSEALATVNVALGPYPSGEVDAATTLARLKDVGARVVTVKKLREGKLWQGPNGWVKVERARIGPPQSILSIGLETWADPEGPGLLDEQAKEDIRAASKELGLDREPLKVMNYMDAVAVWASGGNI